MKKIFKRNQIIVTVLAILIIAAGYLKYTDDNVKTKDEEAANLIYESTYSADDLLSKNDIASLDENESEDKELNTKGSEEVSTNDVEETTIQPGEAVMTNSDLTDFIMQSRIDREQTRSKNKEELLEIINNDKLNDNEKKKAVEAMVEITNKSELENTIETLLEAKGFNNVIVTISDEQVDVIVDETDINNQQRAQIEETIKRKTKMTGDKVVITPVRN